MKVYVEGFDANYEAMFQRRGHTVVDTVANADLVQFVGGADVAPELYGEPCHPNTSFSDLTDIRSENLYENAIINRLPVAGICRGGQFLNVMLGGKMYQHVDNHAIFGEHDVVDLLTDTRISCTSTHHQMMRGGPLGRIIGVAKEATFKEHMSQESHIVSYMGDAPDTEVVWYEESKALCFQPHPEIVGKDHPCQDYYFRLLEHCLGLS